MTNDITVLFAKVFLYHADPYGDGIRLEHIRNPSPAHRAASELVYEGQHTLDGLALMKAERGTEIMALLCDPHSVSAMVRNSTLTRDNVKELKRFLRFDIKP